jgi:hypothetical protein
MNHTETHESSPSPFAESFWVRAEWTDEERDAFFISLSKEWLERLERGAKPLDTEDAIDRAMRAAQRAGQAARQARPVEVRRDAPQELLTLAEVLSRRAQQFIVIQDMPGTDENVHLKLLLATIAEFIDQARDIRRSLAVQFINRGSISRKQTAEILGVHQQTIASWVKEDTQHPEQALSAMTNDSLNTEDSGKPY